MTAHYDPRWGTPDYPDPEQRARDREAADRVKAWREDNLAELEARDGTGAGTRQAPDRGYEYRSAAAPVTAAPPMDAYTRWEIDQLYARVQGETDEERRAAALTEARSYYAGLQDQANAAWLTSHRTGHGRA